MPWVGMLILAASVSVGRSPIALPIEVVGDPGTVVPVWLEVKASRPVCSLWMQIHGLGFPGMASVQVNGGAWIPLNNESVAVAEPGRSYGGIGGGFASLKMSLPLAAGVVLTGPNTIRFRFNRTDGVSSGFRVLGLNFLTADGEPILPGDAFRQEDPNGWRAPFSDSGSIVRGQALWTDAPLVANGLAGAKPIRAHCADCHARDGRDLKYFNFSNASIVARARFHGLSRLEGEQIASYVRMLRYPNPGRPWNPPYQPGPGLDAANWAAGAGLSAVLEDDADSVPVVLRGAIAPDGDLDARVIPISMQLPDWNHWLPRVHPLDMRESRFEGSGFSRLYEGSSPAVFFNRWINARAKVLRPPNPKSWTPELAEEFYSAQLWQLVKTWEIVQENDLEYGMRSWPNTIPAVTAPAAVHIPNDANGMGGSALTNEYFNSAWYEVQILLNPATHQRRGKLPLDWIYLIGHFLDLQKLSQHAEPGRLLIAVVKAMQSSDPGSSPRDWSTGWRPEQNIDPRIVVDSPGFETLPQPVRVAVAEAMLTAWLDKTESYSPASYFERGRSAKDYLPPGNLRGVSGGKVWESAERFRALGVRAGLIRRLEEWGRVYSDTAGRFHY